MASTIDEKCVAVALNGHMLSWLAMTDGEQGQFIKANRHPSGGNCFVVTTPSGTKLAGGNGSGGAEAALKEGLAQWERLSDQQRKQLPDGKAYVPPEAVLCSPPPGGLVVASYVRNLKRDAAGKLSRITKDDLKDKDSYPGWNLVYTEPARFNLWLTADEWKSLVPAQPTVGQSFAVPEPIRWRIFRYHLADGTYGLPAHWKRQHVRWGELMLTVRQVSPVLQLELRGAAKLATGDDDRSGHGYEATLSGVLEYDPVKKSITRFDVVAVGDCWGGDWEGGRFARPGRQPLGVAFQLVSGKGAADRVPPLVHMDRQEVYTTYFQAEKP